jgi:adenine-specific DNA-methyltransferase
LVLSQKWAELKRKLLVILACRILEAKSYNEAIKRGEFQPFTSNPEAVVICSYQFA